MRQELTHDSVSRYIEASPEQIYAFVSDLTRQHETSPEIASCEWLDGATGPAVGARFKAMNHAGRLPDWPNKPVVIVADEGREFAISRTEPFAGTLEWRYVLEPEGTGTRVTESYTVTKPISIVGWFIIDTLYGLKDRQADLHAGMLESLDRLAGLMENSDQTRTS